MKNIDDYINIYKNGLLEDIIPFWLKHSLDIEYGGFIFSLDRDGSILDTDKSVWLTGRFIWMLATMYNEIDSCQSGQSEESLNVLKEKWLNTAIHGADFLEKYAYDKDGRMYFQLTREGNPLRKRRYVFSESFAAIAFAALYRATGLDRYAQKARECFDIYYRYSTIPGMIEPKFTEYRQMSGLGGPMIGIVTAQELRKNLGDDSYTDYIDSWISGVESRFMKPEHKAVMESVGPAGEIIDHFDGRTLTPGHSIEAAWFILNEAKYRGGDKKLVDTGKTILDWMWERGWDKEYGGVLYFTDLKGLPIQEYWHDMKFWWPQCETIIAAIMAYEASGEEKYFKWFEEIHDYAFSSFPDNEYGEWYGYLHRDGTISVSLKGNLWKGPFHIPRMYLKVWQTLVSINKKLLL